MNPVKIIILIMLLLNLISSTIIIYQITDIAKTQVLTDFQIMSLRYNYWVVIVSTILMLITLTFPYEKSLDLLLIMTAMLSVGSQIYLLSNQLNNLMPLMFILLLILTSLFGIFRFHNKSMVSLIPMRY